jgi:hypothetical protein
MTMKPRITGLLGLALIVLALPATAQAGGTGNDPRFDELRVLMANRLISQVQGNLPAERRVQVNFDADAVEVGIAHKFRSQVTYFGCFHGQLTKLTFDLGNSAAATCDGPVPQPWPQSNLSPRQYQLTVMRWMSSAKKRAFRLSGAIMPSYPPLRVRIGLTQLSVMMRCPGGHDQALFTLNGQLQSGFRSCDGTNDGLLAAPAPTPLRQGVSEN